MQHGNLLLGPKVFLSGRGERGKVNKHRGWVSGSGTDYLTIWLGVWTYNPLSTHSFWPIDLGQYQVESRLAPFDL